MSTDPNKAIRIAQAQSLVIGVSGLWTEAIRIAQAQLVLFATLSQATVDAARARDQARADGVTEALAEARFALALVEATASASAAMLAEVGDAYPPAHAAAARTFVADLTQLAARASARLDAGDDPATVHMGLTMGLEAAGLAYEAARLAPPSAPAGASAALRDRLMRPLTRPQALADAVQVVIGAQHTKEPR